MSWMAALLLSACAGDAATLAPATDTLAKNGPTTGMVFRAVGGQGGEADGLSSGEHDDRGRAEQSTGNGPKLMRTGQISVVVDEFGPYEAELEAWLSAAGGYVANASLSHDEGRVGDASLVVRVPADQLDQLVGWTEERVEVRHLAIESADVTEEWVDVSARIENHRRTETRLRELLDNDAAELADVLAVERELARVRGEIEAAEGRMRVLSDRVSLATLTLHVQVTQVYEPYVAPSFGDELTSALGGSLRSLQQTGRAVTIAGVAAMPWLVVLGGSGAALLAFGSRLRRRRREGSR